MDLDVQGALAVRKRLSEAVLVFLLPPSVKDLKARMLKRGTECPRAVDKRLTAAQKEIASALDYDYLIVNDQVAKATKQLTSVVEAEKLKVSRQSAYLEILAEGGTIGNC